MKEEYLHYLWKTKNIPQQNLTLTDGRPIAISSFGFHNIDSGPDFSNGSVTIDGITWMGNIEIHINSSDWYKHNHQADSAYDNVILHVVYHHDKPVFINKEEIPTLELKNYISKSHFEHYNYILNNKKWIPCQDEIITIDPLHINNQLEFAVFQRLERKMEGFNSRFKELYFDLNQLIIEQLASCLGTKVNREPMIELIQRIPSTIYAKESNENVAALLFEVSNLLPENAEEEYIQNLKNQGKFYRSKYQIHPLKASSWKFFGSRAPGFPPFRIAQFSTLISNPKFLDFLVIPIEEWLHWFHNEKFTIDEFWLTHYHFEVKTKSHSTNMSSNLKELILINVIVPIFYWWGIYQNKDILTEKAFELLENIPPEKNSIVNNWKNLGLSLISAKDSQGLLELKNEFCNKTKCLSCKIGHQVLK